MTMRVTEIDLGSVELEGGQFRDELITFAGEGTLKAGTILARDSVSKKMVPFAKGGSTNENGIAKAVLTYEVSAAAAGDEPARALVSGRVRAERLIIAADGDGENVDADVLDGLRAFSIVAIDVQQLARFEAPDEDS
jgi:hypothetical protein